MDRLLIFASPKTSDRKNYREQTLRLLLLVIVEDIHFFNIETRSNNYPRATVTPTTNDDVDSDDDDAAGKARKVFAPFHNLTI